MQYIKTFYSLSPDLLANEIKNYADEHNYKIISVSHNYRLIMVYTYGTVSGEWDAIVVFEDKN